MAAGWGSLLWFAAVVALIPLALWLLKRSPLGGGGMASRPGTPRVVAVLPLSAQHKLVTVEVGHAGQAGHAGPGDGGRQWLVLGVSPQGLTTLHTMAALGDAPVGAAPVLPGAAFAQLLSRWRGGESKGSDSAAGHSAAGDGATDQGHAR